VLDILELTDRITLLYNHAQLDGENSELDALKRLASSQKNTPAAVPPLSAQLSTSTLPNYSLPRSRSMETSSQATAVPAPAEFRVKRECETALEQPGASGKQAKLLLIPDSLPSLTKLHTVATGNDQATVTQQPDMHGGGWKGDRPGAAGPTKKRNASEGGQQKSVPLGDVMNVNLPIARVSSPRGAVNAKLPSVSPQGAANVKLPGANVITRGAVNAKLPSLSPRGSVSLIPLTSVGSSVSSAHSSPVTLDWNQQVKIKVEPGLSCERAGKRKRPVEHGMFIYLNVLC